MSAPSVWKMRLTSAVCSANPNWMPRNPKHMFQICQNESSGLWRGSCPAGIDDDLLGGEHGAVIRRQKERESRDVVRPNEAFEILVGENDLLLLRRDPEAQLALGHDATGAQRIHADAVHAEVARQTAGEPVDGGLGGGIDGQVRSADTPADRAEVDDRAAAELAHLRGDRLGREEHGP